MHWSGTRSDLTMLSDNIEFVEEVVTPLTTEGMNAHKKFTGNWASVC